MRKVQNIRLAPATAAFARQSSLIAQHKPSPLAAGDQLHQVGTRMVSKVRLLEPVKASRFAMVLRHAIGLMAGVIAIRLRHGRDYQQLGWLVRRHVVEMGGLWVRVGRFIGDHRNVLPEDFCEVLLQIHDRTDGFTFGAVRQIVEMDLGKPREDVFESFAPAPMAATSTSQTHRALLRREQIWVAVKVQRPNIEEIIRANLRILRRCAPLLRFVLGIPEASWEHAFWRFDRIMIPDLDYRLEAAHMKRMTKSLRKHGVLVPKVFEEYSGVKTLSKEFVTGVSVSEYLKAVAGNPARPQAWRHENDIDPHQLGRTLFHSLLRQVLEEDLFHTDWNPMNVIILRNNRVAIVDFYAMHSIDKGMQKKISMM